MRTFLVHTFGCRAAQADGAALEGLLQQQGLAPVKESGTADLVILNTCTVTTAADDEVRQVTRRVHRENPGARILITGCYAQRAPQELAALPGVAWVVGNSDKTRIPELVFNTQAVAPYHGEIHVRDIQSEQEFLAAPVTGAFGERSRPNLKIQDGCSNRCSFCIIPSVRGRSRSMPLAQVVEQVRALAKRYAEVVLSGINLGRWGRDLDRKGSRRLRLADAVRTLLAETGVQRLRLSSVEPMDFSDELLGLMAESRHRVAWHVHAPLQSGSDTVLRRMRRKYRPRHYEERILRARQWMPDAAIGADVMTGFPGETEEEFEQSRAFIERLPFTYLHVFTYSERPGTEAVEAPPAKPVPLAVRKERNRVLRELAAKKNLAFRRSQIGRSLPAVTLEGGGARALSSNYLKIALSTQRAANRLVEIRIGGLTEDGLREAALLPVLSGPLSGR